MTHIINGQKPQPQPTVKTIRLGDPESDPGELVIKYELQAAEISRRMNEALRQAVARENMNAVSLVHPFMNEPMAQAVATSAAAQIAKLEKANEALEQRVSELERRLEATR